MSRLQAAITELVGALREELAPTTAEPPPDRLMSVEQAAEALGVGRTSVYAAIAAEQLRSFRVGRRRLVSSSAIAEFIAQAESRGAAGCHGRPTPSPAVSAALSSAGRGALASSR